MNYLLQIRKLALKELSKLPGKVKGEISTAIDDLAENPRPHGSKKLKGEKEKIWRIRVGDYRVLYQIEDTVKIVDVRKVGHRKDVYE